MPVNVNTPSADHAEMPSRGACPHFEHPAVIAKILTHLGVPARAPPRAVATALDRFPLAFSPQIPASIRFSP